MVKKKLSPADIQTGRASVQARIEAKANSVTLADLLDLMESYGIRLAIGPCVEPYGIQRA